MSVAAVAACSGPLETPAAPGAADGSRPALLRFMGSIDVEQGTMTVVTLRASGEYALQVQLPYGETSGDVFFHTCSGTVTYNVGTHQLTGNVQGVNLTSATLSPFDAVIDSVSPTGISPSSGTIASYGPAAPNAADCLSFQVWTFTDPTDTNFSFTGHAEGCSLCASNEYTVTACTSSNDTVCGPCDVSCATCLGPSNLQCASCPSGQVLL